MVDLSSSLCKRLPEGTWQSKCQHICLDKCLNKPNHPSLENSSLTQVDGCFNDQDLSSLDPSISPVKPITCIYIYNIHISYIYNVYISYIYNVYI